jgi:HEPN domain-containing protein
METLRFVPTSLNSQQSVETAINNIFPLASDESKTIKLRKALGETAKSLPDEQIETIGTEFQFLIDSWMDEYEQDVFNGLTLKEVLHDG